MEGTLGEIRLFAGDVVPVNWALCKGQAMSITQNSALYAVIGNTFGGLKTENEFYLPDFRGRSALTWDSMDEPDYIGKYSTQIGGRYAKRINDWDLPEHSHIVNIPVNSEDPNESDPVNFLAKELIYHDGESSEGNLIRFSRDLVGNGKYGESVPPTPVNNMQPFLVVNHIICIKGKFSSFE